MKGISYHHHLRCAARPGRIRPDRSRPGTCIKAVALLAFLHGCGGTSHVPTPMPPATPAQQYTEPEDRYSNPGSLYSETESSDLYADSRARRIGDIIMVNVVENAKSKSKADTKASKISKNEFGVSAAFGSQSVGLFGAAGGPLAAGISADPLFSSSTSSNLSATGETKRENYVTATIGARVMQVLPGGVLQVQGAREVRVNEETQYMVVSGLVRNKDVAADNSILSTQMADSRIEYYGKGVLSDQQRPGWLTRLLSNVWPF